MEKPQMSLPENQSLPGETDLDLSHPIASRALFHRAMATRYAASKIPKGDPLLAINRTTAAMEYLSFRLAILELRSNREYGRE
jgi:hypothetical protein